MTDFTLVPDEPDPDQPSRRRPVRVFPTGLADTAEVPASATKGQDPPPAYAPCEACGALVLCGQTREGTRLALDVHRPTYTVLWEQGTPLPRLEPSRGYPVHRCEAREVV